MIGSLGQPILFLFALGFGFGPIFARAGGGNYLEFVAPGIIAMGIIFNAVFGGIEIIWDRQFGFLEGNAGGAGAAAGHRAGPHAGRRDDGAAARRHRAGDLPVRRLPHRTIRCCCRWRWCSCS